LVGLDVGWGLNWFEMHAPLVEALGPSCLMESSLFPHANFFCTSLTCFTYHNMSNDGWERVGLVGLDVGWGTTWFGMYAPLVEALGPSFVMESSPFPHANFILYVFDMFYIS
jgi:hypothetical protein